MNRKEKYSYRYLGDGFKVSNDTRETHLNNNDLIVGSSGSSKTGSIVYAQLKSLKDSSLIVADTKGRLAKMFSEELNCKGYNIKTLDFVNPENSDVTYNPLDYIRRDELGNYREQDIAKLAACLVPLEYHHEAFWPMSARTVLEFAVAFTLMALPEENHNMRIVESIIGKLMVNDRKYFEPWISEHYNTLAASRYIQIQGMRTADKTIASIFAIVNNAIKSFAYKEYRVIFQPYYNSLRTKEEWEENPFVIDDFDVDERRLDFSSLGKEKTVLFLNISDSDHSLDDVVNLFYAQALQGLMSEADAQDDGQLNVPVRIIMDDFASSAIIPDFDKLISVVRSRDIWLTLCIQSFTQLETLYSHSQAMTVINNCDHIVYLGSNDMQSAQFIGTRALKTPEAILCTDRQKEFILEAGKPVSLVNKIPSYSFELEEENDDQLSA